MKKLLSEAKTEEEKKVVLKEHYNELTEEELEQISGGRVYRSIALVPGPRLL